MERPVRGNQPVNASKKTGRSPAAHAVGLRLSVSKKWQMPLFRGSKFGQPEVARICKELILQAKSTTQQGAVFPQGKTAVAKRLGFSFEKPTVRRQSRLTRMKVGGAAAPPTPPKGFLTVWPAPAPQGTGARLPFQAEPQKKSLSLPWPAKAPASMGPEGFQRAIGKPFGRLRRGENPRKTARREQMSACLPAR